MTPRPIAFTGKTMTRHLTPHVVIRITPTLHVVGSLPPVPAPGCIVPIVTGSTCHQAQIVSSSRDKMVILLAGKRWGMSPIRPSEVGLAPSYQQDSGATDWVIRAEA